MKSIQGTKTEQNLLKAFAGESQARNCYTLFAQKAKEEGYEQIMGIFAETAEQGVGTCHPILQIHARRNGLHYGRISGRTYRQYG